MSYSRRSAVGRKLEVNSSSGMASSIVEFYCEHIKPVELVSRGCGDGDCDTTRCGRDGPDVTRRILCFKGYIEVGGLM